MPKLKQLAGSDIIKIFRKYGFYVVAQKGSHVKLRRDSDMGKQVLTIPDHKIIDKGTLRAIIRQAGAFIPMEDLKKEFYTK